MHLKKLLKKNEFLMYSTHLGVPLYSIWEICFSGINCSVAFYALIQVSTLNSAYFDTHKLPLWKKIESFYSVIFPIKANWLKNMFCCFPHFCKPISSGFWFKTQKKSRVGPSYLSCIFTLQFCLVPFVFSVCFETNLFVSVVSKRVRNTETNRKIIFWFRETNRKSTETDCVSVCFGSNRK
jgi:hypothetical protein